MHGLPDLEPARPPKYMRKRSPAVQMRCMPLSKASALTRKSGSACSRASMVIAVIHCGYNGRAQTLLEEADWRRRLLAPFAGV